MTSSKLHKGDGARVSFYCPGCKDTHDVDTSRWQWNGSMDAPTFSPSILVRSGHYAVGVSKDIECWCTYNAAHPDNPAPFKCYQCHSFVREGYIQFLGDCTHELAGQTVPIPEWGAYPERVRTHPN